MTGNKKDLTLMNRYGHCASSETVQRVGISLESICNNSDSFIPDGTETKPNLSTGTAWDNFDINLEAPSGADTIHHTDRICYETIKETDEIETEESSEIHLNLNQPHNQLQHQSTAPKSKKRKLTRFSKATPSPDNELETYLKNKKLSFKFSFSNNEVCPSVSYLKYSSIYSLDFGCKPFLKNTNVGRLEHTTIS